MSDLPLLALLGALLCLLILSGFFSGSETAMMAANRYRLRHRAQHHHHRGSRLALGLLDQTDKLMGLILLGNTLLNAAAAALTSYLALALLGESKWALEIGTLCITFALLVIAEITPKVVCATHADRIAPVISYVLTPLMRFTAPIIWFVNLFVSGLLRLLRLTPGQLGHDSALTQEELRSLVLESAHFIPQKHRAILANLFELNAVCVEDVITPRSGIEILDLEQPWDDVVTQLATSHHSRLPVCRESLDNLIGMLSVRRLIGEIQREDLNEESLLGQLTEPYYIPAGTPAFAQLAFFQENRQRCGFVIDEYGEILGMLTLEDIMEEIVGRFTTTLPDHFVGMAWDENGTAVVDGTRNIREINHLLSISLPTDGPKTINGLILEHFQDIPESGVSFKIDGIQIEVLQTQDRSVRTAKLFKPAD